MKKTNKGFSLVELIIVIAIMAILAGALAPALIKYINKSRISSCISNGQQIASAVQTAMSNEKAFDNAEDVTTATGYADFLDDVCSGSTTDMKDAITAIIGSKEPTAKVKKDMSGSTIGNTDQTYKVYLSIGTNEVKVYYGPVDNDHMLYPSVGDSWTD